MTTFASTFAPLAIQTRTHAHTRENRRLYLAGVLDRTVEGILKDELTVCEEPYGCEEEDGTVRYVGDETVTIEVDDEALLGFYADRCGSFTGCLEGCGWKATVSAARRTRGVLALTLDVTSE